MTRRRPWGGDRDRLARSVCLAGYDSVADSEDDAGRNDFDRTAVQTVRRNIIPLLPPSVLASA